MNDQKLPEAALAEKIVNMLRQEGGSSQVTYAALLRAAIEINGIGGLLGFIRWATMFMRGQEL